MRTVVRVECYLPGASSTFVLLDTAPYPRYNVLREFKTFHEKPYFTYERIGSAYVVDTIA